MLFPTIESNYFSDIFLAEANHFLYFAEHYPLHNKLFPGGAKHQTVPRGLRPAVQSECDSSGARQTQGEPSKHQLNQNYRTTS